MRLTPTTNAGAPIVDNQMKVIVRRSAAADVILEHARVTFTEDQSRGGMIQELATSRLKEILDIIDYVSGEQDKAEKAVTHLTAAVCTKDDAAEATIGQISNEIWNALGRAANESSYGLLYPGGIRAFTDAPVDEVPDLIKLLVELLDLPIRPKLPGDLARKWQNRLTAVAAPMREAVEARRPVAVRMRLHSREKIALPRVAQIRLMSLRRDFKTEGLTELLINAIIPDASKDRSPALPYPFPTPNTQAS